MLEWQNVLPRWHSTSYVVTFPYLLVGGRKSGGGSRFWMLDGENTLDHDEVVVDVSRSVFVKHGFY
jgi:hypothetical protein